MRLVRLLQLAGCSLPPCEIMGIAFRGEAGTVSPGNADQCIARPSGSAAICAADMGMHLKAALPCKIHMQANDCPHSPQSTAKELCPRPKRAIGFTQLSRYIHVQIMSPPVETHDGEVSQAGMERMTRLDTGVFSGTNGYRTRSAHQLAVLGR